MENGSFPPELSQNLRTNFGATSPNVGRRCDEILQLWEKHSLSHIFWLSVPYTFQTNPTRLPHLQCESQHQEEQEPHLSPQAPSGSLSHGCVGINHSAASNSFTPCQQTEILCLPPLCVFHGAISHSGGTQLTPAAPFSELECSDWFSLNQHPKELLSLLIQVWQKGHKGKHQDCL